MSERIPEPRPAVPAPLTSERPTALPVEAPAPRALEGRDRLLDSTILMVDDEESAIDVLQILLEDEGYSNLLSTTESREAFEMIERHQPDVVLLDLMMPGVNGFEILEAMRGSADHLVRPVIILTAETDPETKLRALELGATDLLAKPVDPSELALRLRNTLAAKLFRDRVERYDSLTDLPNRKSFLERLERALRRSREDRANCAVVTIDLDRFREINDGLGHDTGDAVLRQVADRLEACVRPGDLLDVPGLREEREPLSRSGSDEFSLFLPNVESPDAAVAATRRLLDEIGRPLSAGGQEMALTGSAGIAMFPDDGDDAASLLRNAATALTRAKRDGFGHCRFYSRSQNIESFERLHIANQLAASARSLRSLAALPAEDQPAHRSHRGGRGAHALAPRRAGPGVARALHPDRRAVGSDPGARPLGARRGLPAGSGVGGVRPAAAARLGERLARAVP